MKSDSNECNCKCKYCHDEGWMFGYELPADSVYYTAPPDFFDNFPYVRFECEYCRE